METPRITRSGSKKRAAGYDSGELKTVHYMNLINDGAKSKPLENRDWLQTAINSYYWDKPTAAKVFGPHDGCFRGEYLFHIRILTFHSEKFPGETVEFLLLSDPKTSQKGSIVEIIQPQKKPSPELIIELLQTLHNIHPNTPK